MNKKELKEIVNIILKENNRQSEIIFNLQQENKTLKELEYKFLDDCNEEESFTLEEYLELGYKVYDLERENIDLKERIDKVRKYINGGCEGHDYYEYDYILELLDGGK